MIDFSQSKDNAKLLIERFLENGDQPKFLEFLCFKGCYVDGEFYGYGAEYVINNFQIYVAISEDEVSEIIECSTYGKINQVLNCSCACEGHDFITEARDQGVDFTMKNGRLHLIKDIAEREALEVEYDKYSYYSRRVSKTSN